MYNAYPYNPSWDRERLRADADSGRPKTGWKLSSIDWSKSE